MAITVDDIAADGYLTFDSADASGTEELKAAVTGVTYGATALTYTCAVAGESLLSIGGRAFYLQLPANGGITTTFPTPIWGDAATAIELTSPAGAASGTLHYVSR